LENQNVRPALKRRGINEKRVGWWGVEPSSEGLNANIRIKDRFQREWWSSPAEKGENPAVNNERRKANSKTSKVLARRSPANPRRDSIKIESGAGADDGRTVRRAQRKREQLN